MLTLITLHVQDITGWGENDRGVSYTFGGDIVRQFLKKQDCSLIVRAHQVSFHSNKLNCFLTSDESRGHVD